MLRPLVLDAALPLRPCTLRDRPATGGLCPAALPGRRTCDAPAPEPEEDAEGPRDRPSAEPGRVLVRSEVPPLCVGVGERDGIPIAGDAGLDRDAADDAERDDEPTLLGGLAPDGASDARRFEERDAGRDDSRTASPPAAAAPSRLGGRIPAGAAPTAAPPRPRIVALLAMPPPAVPAPAPVGDPMRGIALPRMTPTLRWSRRLVSALTRVVICCMSRIMVAVSVRGIPRAGLCGRRDEDEEEGVPKPAGPGRVLAGEERFGVEGDEVSPLAPVRARCAVRVERARGGAPCTRGARKGAGLEGGRAEKEVERAILEGEERAEDGGGDMAAAAEGRMRDERRGVGLVSSMEGEGESGGVGEGVRRRGVSSSLGEAAEEEGKGDGDSGSTGVGGTEEGAEDGAGGAAASCVRVNESSSLTSVEGKRASAGRACWEGRVGAPRSSSLSLCTSSSSCALVTSSSSSRAMRSSALLYRDSRSCSVESFSLRARPQEEASQSLVSRRRRSPPRSRDAVGHAPLALLEVVVVEFHVADAGTERLFRRAESLELALHVRHGLGVVPQGARVLGPPLVGRVPRVVEVAADRLFRGLDALELLLELGLEFLGGLGKVEDVVLCGGELGLERAAPVAEVGEGGGVRVERAAVGRAGQRGQGVV